ncbi:MAG: hypothetical protein AAF974_09985 [Cyanobacteria bacterium P01_E01_bin.34]
MLRTAFHRFEIFHVRVLSSWRWMRSKGYGQGLLEVDRFLTVCSVLAVGSVLTVGSLLAGAAIAQPEVAIEADTIDYDQSSALVRAEGNFIVTQGGAELRGDRGSYNNASGQSILIGNTTLMVGDREFNTQRLEGNHRNEIFLLEGDVNSPLDSDLEVRSDAMVYRGTTEEATFTGEVEVISKQWIITATRAELNEGELTLFDGWKEATSATEVGGEEIEPLPSLFEARDPEERRESFERLTLDIATRVAHLNVAED